MSNFGERTYPSFSSSPPLFLPPSSSPLPPSPPPLARATFSSPAPPRARDLFFPRPLPRTIFAPPSLPPPPPPPFPRVRDPPPPPPPRARALSLARFQLPSFSKPLSPPLQFTISFHHYKILLWVVSRGVQICIGKPFDHPFVFHMFEFLNFHLETSRVSNVGRVLLPATLMQETMEFFLNFFFCAYVML